MQQGSIFATMGLSPYAYATGLSPYAYALRLPHYVLPEGHAIQGLRAPKPRAARRGRRSGGTRRYRATAANNPQQRNPNPRRTFIASGSTTGGRPG